MITVTRQPEPVTSAHKPIVFGLSISDIGTSPVSKKIAYQLFDEFDNPITALESITPNESDKAYLFDFQKDVKFLVNTYIPDLQSGFHFADESVQKGIKLKYTEITLNALTCNTTVGTTNETDLIRIINGVFQRYEVDLFNNPVMVMSHQPLQVIQYRSTRNFIWVKGETQVDTTIVATNGDLTIESKLIQADEVMVCPFHCKGIFGPQSPDAKEVRVKIYELDIEYKAIILDDDCEGKDHRNIMFLDSLGGRSMIAMESVESFEMSTDFQIIEKYQLPIISVLANDYVNDLTIGGQTILNKTSKDVLNLTVSVDNTKEYAEWFKAFLASPGYHIQVTKFDEIDQTPFLKKFILNSGQLIYNKPDERLSLQISGYMAHGYENQMFDRL